MFDFFSSDTLATVLFIFFIFQFKTISGFLNLMKVRMRNPGWVTAERALAPVATLHLLDCAGLELEKIGFERVCTQMSEPLNYFDPRSQVFADLYWQSESAVLAHVGLAEALSGQATSVQFISQFSEGPALVTINRGLWTQLPIPEEIEMADAYADTLEAQWRFHRDALHKALAHRLAITDKEEACRRSVALGFSCWLARMQELGWINRENSGLYGLTAKGAWAYARQLNKPPAQVKQALARPYRHDPEPDVLPARLAEMNSVAANIALAAQPYPSWIKTALFALTLAFSFVLFRMGFDLIDVAALLLVLLVHELGHLLAMWAFDYRNLSIFFLPFLGAAAVGHKPHAPVWQESIVLLSGPALGLLLALAASQIPSDVLAMPLPEFVRAFIQFGLVINLFNLLPVGVLDGGRLFELAVLGRFPYARAVFTCAGLLVGIAYAVWNQSMVFGAVMLLLLLGTPIHFKAARVTKAIRAKNKALGLSKPDKEAVMTALGHEFADKAYGESGLKGWSRRTSIAQLAYPRLLQGVPTLGVSLGAISAQVFCLLAPLALVLWSLQQAPAPAMQLTKAEQTEMASQIKQAEESPGAKASRVAFQARFDAEQDLGKKLDMLDEGAEDQMENFGFSSEFLKWQEQQRTALLQQLPADHPSKLSESLYKIDTQSAGAGEAILAIINQLTGNGAHKLAELDEKRFDLLMSAYEALARTAKPELYGGQLLSLFELWNDLQAPNHPLAAYKSRLALIQARLSVAPGYAENADIWMDHYVVNAQAEDSQAALVYAWFHLDRGHSDKALDLARQALKADNPQNGNPIDWQTLAGWAEMGRGHAREADGYFQTVLDSRVKNLEEMENALPWWAKLVSVGANEPFKGPGIDRQTFDHLAALQIYNPSEASLILADLAKLPEEKKQGRAANIYGYFAVWGGKARQEAHYKLLKGLGLSPPKPTELAMRLAG